jgi:hypothetical protein
MALAKQKPKYLNYKTKIEMKKTAITLICLSFLLFAACVNFDENNKHSTMSSWNIPEGEYQLNGNPVWVLAESVRENVTEQYMNLSLVCTNGLIDDTPRILRIKGDSVAFNLQALVDVPFAFNFDWENDMYTFEASMLIERSGNLAEFEFTIFDSFVDANGDYVEDAWLSEPQPIKILNGKLTNLKLASLRSYNSYFFKEYIMYNRFLNSIEKHDQIFNVKKLEHEVKLWFAFYGETPVPILWRINYTDGTFDEGSHDILNPSETSLYEFNAAIFIQWKADEAKQVQNYTVELDADVRFSRAIVNIENQYTENHSVLYIVNRLGVVEAINCYGEMEEGGSSEIETYTKQASLTPQLLDSTIEAVSARNTSTIKINTGHLTLDERRWVSGLLLSPTKKAWLKNPSVFESIVPVIIMPGQHVINNTSEDLMSFDIELQIAHFE